METIFRKPNPKALQLDGLDSITKKVTVGFKCNAKIKLKLAKEAKDYGLTLSEYIENILLDLEEASRPNTQELFMLKERLSFYENEILKNLFKQYEGEEVEFKKFNGEVLKIKIMEPRDIYTIIINSFKIIK